MFNDSLFSVAVRCRSSRAVLLPLARKSVFHWTRLLALLCSLFPAGGLRAEDVMDYQLTKGENFVQQGTAAPSSATNSPYQFQVLVDPIGYPTFYFNNISSPVIHTPGGAQYALTLNAQSLGGVAATNFVFQAGAVSPSALDSAFGAGTYTLDYTGMFDGLASIALPLGVDAFPPAPYVSNLVAAQSIDAGSDFTLQFGVWPGANTNDYVQLTIFDATSNVVFSTPAVYAIYPQVPLAATNTSIVITNGALAPNQSYTATLVYLALTTNDFSGVPLVAAGFSSQTTFALRTGSASITNGPPPAAPPSSLTNSVLMFVIGTGTGPFAGTGAYDIFTDVGDTNSTLLGNAGGGFGAGGYVYLPTGTNTATVQFNDPRLGAITMQLVFLTADSGTYVLSNSNGMQTGQFTLGAAYAVPAAPALFLPGLTNRQFQAYVSGLAGVTYAVDASSNLLTWAPFTSLAIPNLTSNLLDTTANARRFYRARIASVAFAPASLAGQTLNCSVAAGAAPFAATGVFELALGTNGLAYQWLAGSGATNGAGTCTYAVTGPNSATLVYYDTGSGATCNAQLLFTSVTTGYFYTTNVPAGGFQTGSFTVNSGPTLFLGNANFTPDNSHGASVNFPANGTPVSLTVTDALGYAWTLTVPGDALLDPATLTMAPAAAIQTNQLVLPLTSGVQLGPEGIQFCDGVTLAVTAPSPLGTHAALMMATGTGAGLYLVAVTNQANTYATTLFHFSSGWVSNPDDAAWQDFLNKNLPQALAAYNQASAQVTALKRVVVQPPPPPDDEFNCAGNDAAGSAAADAYTEALFATESSAIRNLLSASRDLVLLTGDDSYGSAAIALSAQLTESSEFRKVNALLANYSGAPLKYTAVARAALSVARQDQLLGGPGLPNLLSQLAAWASGNVLNYYWNKLIQQHDYTMAPVLLSVDRQVALLGGATDTETFLQNLAYGYTFDVTLTCTATAGNIAVKAHGTVTLPGNAQNPVSVGTTPDNGIVTGNSFSYDYGTAGTCTLQLPLSFGEGGYFNLGCDDTLVSFYLLQAMGSTLETWSCTGVGLESETELGTLFATAFAGYTTPQGTDATYVFPLPWTNRQAQPANTTFSGGTGFTDNFTIAIQHNPKSAPKTLTP